jgi:hypothetical protein
MLTWEGRGRTSDACPNRAGPFGFDFLNPPLFRVFVYLSGEKWYVLCCDPRQF